MGKKVQMIGQRFGRLVVIEESKARKSNGSIAYICKCDCGNFTPPINGSALRSGWTQSCGCLRARAWDASRSSNTKHGQTDSRLYGVWESMKARCYCATQSCYKNYGGRGITVCDEWLNDFGAFHDWAMANGYDPDAPRGQCTIDRIDVNGNYCPENCRWVTAKEQSKNKRPKYFIEINGEIRTTDEWAKILGITRNALNHRKRRGTLQAYLEKTVLEK